MNTGTTLPNISGKKVFVGLSGGVDSAVSAALLKKRGAQVFGCYIRGWQPEWLKCTWREERRDAMRVCLTLGIPFLFFDLEQEYKREVVDKMLDEYKSGRTPNPDVLCNREIKFGHFWQKAKSLGADYIATGHYLSGEKDQRYFLWTLRSEDLLHSLFPVGHLDKKDVRRLANKFKLPVAEKKDSQGICFLGQVEMSDFLAHYVETEPGKVLDTNGREVGRHNGLVYYTMGQRHGFEAFSQRPLYVVGKDFDKNFLIVSENSLDKAPRKIAVKSVNWQKEPESGELLAQIRYRGEKIPVEFSQDEVIFLSPVPGLSLGQSIVFYQRGEMIGGAIMDKTL